MHTIPTQKYILDACCGSRIFWFDRKQENTIYMDCRECSEILVDGRHLEIKPDIIGDFRNMPFEDNMFNLVVFDPPHLHNLGENSMYYKKYGRLDKNTWTEDIKKGFSECMRVLKPMGTLVFKWNEEQIPLDSLLTCIDDTPLFGNRRAKTHWLVFSKKPE